MRISSPPVKWPCFYGIDFASRAELIANGLSVDEIASSLGATLAWQAQDLNPAGAVGDAAKATPEMGEALLDFAARRMAELWRQVAAVDLDAWLRDMPEAP